MMELFDDIMVFWLIGFSVDNYQQHVANTFLAVVDAARHIVATSGYIAVVAVTTMFAFHVAGWTACRCLRLRLVLPTYSGPVRRRPQLSADSSVQTFIRHRRVDVDCDDDDDDDASDYDEAESSRFDSVPRRSTAPVSCAHGRRYDSSPLTPVAAAACSLGAVEFKYSETNV